MKKYVLKNRVPVVEEDLITWCRWMQTQQGIVRQENIGDVRVSTVFLGLDHNFSDEGPPILWETLIFGGNYYNSQVRCSGSWEQAEAMHQRSVDLVKGLIVVKEVSNE